MKKILTLIMITALIVFVLPVSASAAGQVKIKHLDTVYMDAEGVALQQPTGVSFRDKKLLVADSSGRRIFSYTSMDGQLKPDKSFELPGVYPLMVEVSSNGDFYVLDGRERHIVMVGPTGDVKGKFDTGDAPGGDRMVVRRIKSGHDGTLIVLDLFSENVLLFDSNGDYLRQFPFPEQYKTISDMAMDRQGNVYLLDSVQAMIYKAPSSTGEFKPLTSGMKEAMNFPTSMAVDSNGNIYLIDKYGSGLDVVTADGRYAGRKLSMGWNESFLNYPSLVSISDTGDLFVADTGNHRVQHFSAKD